MSKIENMCSKKNKVVSSRRRAVRRGVGPSRRRVVRRSVGLLSPCAVQAVESSGRRAVKLWARQEVKPSTGDPLGRHAVGSWGARAIEPSVRQFVRPSHR